MSDLNGINLFTFYSLFLSCCSPDYFFLLWTELNQGYGDDNVEADELIRKSKLDKGASLDIPDPQLDGKIDDILKRTFE